MAPRLRAQCLKLNARTVFVLHFVTQLNLVYAVACAQLSLSRSKCRSLSTQVIQRSVLKLLFTACLSPLNSPATFGERDGNDCVAHPIQVGLQVGIATVATN